MSHATIEKPVEADAPPTTHGTDEKGRKTTRTILAIGFVVVVALALLLVFTAPTEESSRITIGFSLNSFFLWLGGLNPLVQIPAVLLVFGVVVAIILVLIEFAPRPGRGYFIMRLVACLVIPVLALLLLRPYANAVVYVVAIALLVGALLFFADFRARQGAGYLFQLVLFMAPAAIMLLLGLIYPAISTIFKSFFDKTGDEFVGLENYIWVFTNPVGTSSVINTIIWALLAPVISVVIGLAYAVFIDRARGEKFLKVLVFMPVAISFVGAGIIWKFMYDARQGDQIGLLNAIVTAFGGDPVQWLAIKPILNTLMLLIVFIWTQTGFAMVILSAAIKAVPVEQMEAAELDGTNAWQRFRNVTVPGIRSSLIVVLTTITIASLKVYDIVAVMTGGRDETSVLGFEMVNQQQRFQSYGHSSALAVVLFLFVLPLIIYNARSMAKQREIR
ncbi:MULTISPECIES: carbohydrate ABC transporter permease [Microbacterium]|jgi:alpha-glucoside transport system permease protein|uniref:Carbohydrate ABC transporter membrane protein 1, CUT1 family n=1 Tax=Microbacterium paraoxydans TaxID=199592 RepID=A0A1H1Q3T8_9MICO|nr:MULTISPECIES: sugar ABC transporter permease [Microbacterium]AMG82371.1 ABC transporter permease [Microbacterium sp. PAMC 28756]AVL97927.1 sugar ABC transporter permease [Microbacterium sp. str. 'China']MPT15583.1 sugar ABC transporter permease [Microbacterium sp.]OIJ33020.1 ABC transporter permease [Microbacterium sp. LCT-H2]OSP05355.1 ABC transporter permease [Microbacterium sp. LEMMJ01]